jgi:hypothetical protein
LRQVPSQITLPISGATSSTDAEEALGGHPSTLYRRLGGGDVVSLIGQVYPCFIPLRGWGKRLKYQDYRFTHDGLDRELSFLNHLEDDVCTESAKKI